jgi:hypothetical protein
MRRDELGIGVPHLLRAAHQGREDLVVVLAAAQVSRDTFASSVLVGSGFALGNSTVAMMKPTYRKPHRNPCSATMPCGTGCSVPSALAKPSIAGTPTLHGVREKRKGIVWYVVEQDRAGAGFGARGHSTSPDDSADESEPRDSRGRASGLLRSVPSAMSRNNARDIPRCTSQFKRLRRGRLPRGEMSTLRRLWLSELPHIRGVLAAPFSLRAFFRKV